MAARLNLLGQTFGKLKVLAFAGTKHNGFGSNTYWLCECKCGTKRDVKGAYLTSGHTTSCMKCAHRLELTGQRFGHWTVLSFAGRRDQSGKWLSHWNCRCDCGVDRVVRGTGLTSGRSTSCSPTCSRTTHGESSIANGKRTVEYIAWTSMIGRCYTPTITGYSNYGGRGIKICDRWRHSYENFLVDMGRKPHPDMHLHRIDPNGNYEPENCIWDFDGKEKRRPTGALETILPKLSIADLEKALAEKKRREVNKQFRKDQKLLAMHNGFID